MEYFGTKSKYICWLYMNFALKLLFFNFLWNQKIAKNTRVEIEEPKIVVKMSCVPRNAF